jgi:AGZA family xanthine/uracil permease-like MFS transporter
MPLTYSVSYGLAAGIITYPLMKVAEGDGKDVRAGQWLLAGTFIIYFVVRTSGVIQTVV